MSIQNTYKRARKQLLNDICSLRNTSADVVSDEPSHEAVLTVNPVEASKHKKVNVYDEKTFDFICDNIFDSFSDSDSGTGNGEFDSTHTDEDTTKPKSLTEELLVFMLLFNVSHSAMQYLLKLLLKHNVDVPPSVYLLRKTLVPDSIMKFDINGGKVAYLSIHDNIIYILKNKLVSIASNYLSINVNVDGLPLFRSSNINLWPILMTVNDMLTPVPIAVYCGVGKPNLNEFVQKFCEELSSLLLNGVSYSGTCVYIKRVVFICDTPARCFLQCIKGHTGYNGCGYCRIKGTYLDDRIVFIGLQNELRTDANYQTFTENNQLSLSPLSSVCHVPLLSAFPPDYMHLVCLGVMKKLLHSFVLPTKGLRLACRLNSNSVTKLSDVIYKFREYVPPDFQRKPRRLSEVLYFKASEYRFFLLYYGPFVFRHALKSEYYDHFLLLHFAMYTFVSNRFSHLHDCAKNCLEIFVSRIPKLFSKKFCSYNVHCLLHVHDFVKFYGPLDSISAFKFESFLGVLKRRIRINNCIFQQTVNQLTQIRSLYSHNKIYPLCFSNKSPNNCALIHNNIVILIHSVRERLVSGNVLDFSRDLYVYPHKSSVLNIGFYKKIEKMSSMWKLLQKL